MAEVNLEGMALADGVVETIIAIALNEMEGVRLVGSNPQAGILDMLSGRSAAQCIDVSANSDNTLSAAVHLEADYGRALPDLAAAVRQTVSDAVLTQVGVDVSAVDVYIDAIRFS